MSEKLSKQKTNPEQVELEKNIIASFIVVSSSQEKAKEELLDSIQEVMIFQEYEVCSLENVSLKNESSGCYGFSFEIKCNLNESNISNFYRTQKRISLISCFVNDKKKYVQVV